MQALRSSLRLALSAMLAWGCTACSGSSEDVDISATQAVQTAQRYAKESRALFPRGARYESLGEPLGLGCHSYHYTAHEPSKYTMTELVRNIGDARGYVTTFREHWVSQGWTVKSDDSDRVSLESPDKYLVVYTSVPDGSRGSIESDTPCVNHDERYPNGGQEKE